MEKTHRWHIPQVLAARVSYMYTSSENLRCDGGGGRTESTPAWHDGECPYQDSPGHEQDWKLCVRCQGAKTKLGYQRNSARGLGYEGVTALALQLTLLTHLLCVCVSHRWAQLLNLISPVATFHHSVSLPITALDCIWFRPAPLNHAVIAPTLCCHDKSACPLQQH